MRFACLDFETANHSDASICAAGVAVFEDARLTDSRHYLIRPPKGHGFFIPEFTAIHGLTWFDVQNAPEFPAVAPEILATLTAADFVVIHNASFDLRKLRSTLTHFNLPCPEFPVICTLELSRRLLPGQSHNLAALCKTIHHDFHHHNAQADAEAAGRVFLALQENAPR